MMSPGSLYIVVTLSSMFYTGVCTTCSETAAATNLPVVAMCTSSLGNGSRLVIDTFDSLLYGTDECTCTGTVTSTVSTSTQLYIHPIPTIQSQPGAIGCGSRIVLQSGSTAITSSCALTGSIEVTDSDTVSVKWELDRKDSVLSKYCIFLQLSNRNDFSLSMTCTSATEGSTTTIPTTTTTPLTTTVTTTTTDRTTTTITKEIISTQQTTTALSNDSTSSSDRESENSIVAVVAVTVSVLVILLVSALLFVFIYRRKSNRDSNAIAEHINSGKSGVPQVIYENTNTQNHTRKHTNEQSEPSSGRPQSAGSQYTQLHVYSNETNDEYSNLGCTKDSIKEDEDKNAYSEVTVDKVEYYNQK